MAQKQSKSKKATKSKTAAKPKKVAKKTPKKSTTTKKIVTGQNPWLVKQFQEEGDPSEPIRTKQKRVEDFYDWLIEEFYNKIPRYHRHHIKYAPRWTDLGGGKWELQIDLDPPAHGHGPGAGSSDPPSPTQPPPKLT